jgi:hypothetical protein
MFQSGSGVLSTLFCLSVAAATTALPAGAEVKKAAGSVELADAVGDAAPITSTDAEYPGFDVVKLALVSDGKTLAVVATLKDAPGVFASSAVDLYFDTDNNAQTGAEVGTVKARGFEYTAELQACADYTDGASACVGGSSKAKVKKHWAAVNLERYKGSDAYDTETVVDSMGFGNRKASAQTPIPATVVQGAIDYADLKVKPGQTIRILVKESCGYRAEDDGLFPEILLTLK